MGVEEVGAMKRAWLVGVVVVALGACGDDEGSLPPDSITQPPGVGGSGGGSDVGACSDLFDEKVVTSYEITIDPAEWAAIHDEFVNWQARQAAGLDIKPYHAVTLQLGGESVPAWIRLKGNSTWFSAVASNPNVKKQFVIAFDQGADTSARFHGVQKVKLDMPTLDRTFLHERLAESFLRDIGLPGLCANSAKLIINGEYYGLYANLEVVNKDFLKRVFPGAYEGDLWKKRSDLKTNENDPARDNSRQKALWKVRNMSELSQLMDVEASLRTWAAEALLPQPDGYWGGNSNFYVYDHPTRGFIWLTDDLDATFEFMPPDMHPLYFWFNRNPARRPGPQYVAMMNDAPTRNRFIEIMAQLVEGWDIGQLQGRVSTWAAQIADALATDPNRSGSSFEDNQKRQGQLSDFVSQRPAFIRSWLMCAQGGGGGADADGDGVASCLDCDDGSASTYPGAAEICGDGVDQNCNGIADDGC
jgi:hypothetical protein